MISMLCISSTIIALFIWWFVTRSIKFFAKLSYWNEVTGCISSVKQKLCVWMVKSSLHTSIENEKYKNMLIIEIQGQAMAYPL